MELSLPTASGGGAFGCSLKFFFLFASYLRSVLILPSNVPVGGTTLVLLLFVLRIRKAENRERSLSLKEKLRSLDYIGCVVFIGAVCSLLLALQWAGQVKPWNSATIIGLFVGFGLLSILFISIQNWQQDKALIPLRLIRLRSIWTSGGVLFCLGMATFAVSPSVESTHEGRC